MSNNPDPVVVKILDREYRVFCEPNERRQLHEAAEFVDQQMRTIRESGGIVGVEKVAVLAALRLANDFLQLQAKEQAFSDNVRGRIRSLRKRLDSGLTSNSDSS